MLCLNKQVGQSSRAGLSVEGTCTPPLLPSGRRMLWFSSGRASSRAKVSSLLSCMSTPTFILGLSAFSWTNTALYLCTCISLSLLCWSFKFLIRQACPVKQRYVCSFFTPYSLFRPISAAATAASQSSSRYSTAADALAALVDAAASAPQMDVAKVKDGKHDREDEMSARRAASLAEQQQQQEAERRSMQSPYSAMSLQGNKAHATYSEGPGVGIKDKGPQTSKSRIEEELRTRGKTTITAANFIDVIITRQIASDKDSRERGSQSSDSSSSCKCTEMSLTQTRHFKSKEVTTLI